MGRRKRGRGSVLLHLAAMAETKCESPTTTTTTEVPEWVIQVDEELRNDEAQINQRRTLDQTDKNQGRCIYRLPSSFQRADFDDVYSPQRAKFSPYYHSRDSISAVEEYLKPTLKDLVRRSGKKLEDYYKAVEGVVEELKDSYDQLHDEWRDDTAAFLKLMVLNGCFLVELLGGMVDPHAHYAPDNPLFSIHEDPGEMELYRRDMLLLENQLPLRLLLVLLETYTGVKHTGHRILGNTIIRIFSLPPLSITFMNCNECEHILEMVRNGLLGPARWLRGRIRANLIRRRKKDSTGSSDFNIPPAIELDKVGIKLKTTGSTCLFGVSFGRKTLDLPLIYVDGATKARFLNIMAFEQLHKDAGNEVTSYIYFMRHLIRDADDVKFLQSRGIIYTSLPSGEVAQMFHALSKGILLDPDDMWYRYFRVARKLKERFDKMSPEWRKELWEKYLRSPWAVISVVAATFLLTLTTIQTVYAVLSYVVPK